MTAQGAYCCAMKASRSSRHSLFCTSPAGGPRPSRAAGRGACRPRGRHGRVRTREESSARCAPIVRVVGRRIHRHCARPRWRMRRSLQQVSVLVLDRGADDRRRIRLRRRPSSRSTTPASICSNRPSPAAAPVRSRTAGGGAGADEVPLGGGHRGDVHGWRRHTHARLPGAHALSQALARARRRRCLRSVPRWQCSRRLLRDVLCGVVAGGWSWRWSAASRVHCAPARARRLNQPAVECDPASDYAGHLHAHRIKRKSSWTKASKKTACA